MTMIPALDALIKQCGVRIDIDVNALMEDNGMIARHLIEAGNAVVQTNHQIDNCARAIIGLTRHFTASNVGSRIGADNAAIVAAYMADYDHEPKGIEDRAGELRSLITHRDSAIRHFRTVLEIYCDSVALKDTQSTAQPTGTDNVRQMPKHRRAPVVRPNAGNDYLDGGA